MRFAGGRGNKDLKRLALLREYETKWDNLALTPDQLQALGKHLDIQLSKTPCDHSLTFTGGWLREQDIEDPERILTAIRDHGGYCDCEVVWNVVNP